MALPEHDPALSAFVSADSLVPAPGNPQTLNRYAYALSNPLKYTDPTGHVAIPAVIVGGTAILALAVAWVAVDYYLVPGGQERYQAAASFLAEAAQGAANNLQRQFEMPLAASALLVSTRKGLQPDEQKHVERLTTGAEEFLNKHQDIAAEVARQAEGWVPPQGRDHVDEAKRFLRGLERSVDTLEKVYRSRNEEARQLIDKALQSGRDVIEKLRKQLQPPETPEND